MKYDLAVSWGAHRQAILATVRHKMTHFHYVISSHDSHIKNETVLEHYLNLLRLV
jgi:hypothetical protein